MLKQIKKHYHWVIAVVAFLLLAVDGGALNTLTALHVGPVSESMGITRAQFSLGISLKNVVGFLTTLFSGVLMVKFGFRTMATLGLCMSAAAYFLLSTTDSYLGLLLGLTSIGLAAGFTTISGPNRLISIWFHKHRGAVLGFVSAATGVGGSVMTMLQSAAIERSSWRASFSLVSIMLVVMAVVVFALIRNRPQQMGLRPFGDGQIIQHKESKHQQRLFEGKSMKELLGSFPFYLAMFCVFLDCLCVYMVSQPTVPFFQTKGLSYAESSQLYSFMLMVMTFTKFFAGALCDAIGAKKVTMLCLGFNALALLCMLLLRGYVAGLVAMVLFAIAMPMVTVTIPLLGVSLFGYKAQAEYAGALISMGSVASILAAPLSNAIFDALGTYDPAFWAAIGVTALAAVLHLVLFRLTRQPDKK